MLMWNSTRVCVRHGLALIAILGASACVLSAQTVPGGRQQTSVSAQAQTSSSSSELFSSSAVDNAPATTDEASLVKPINFANMMQYGGGQRSRYGRPRYRGGNTTDDGAEKYVFQVGAGLVQPVGNTWHYFTPSYGIDFGFGRNFSRKFGVMLNVDYDHFGLTQQTMANQSAIYFNGDTNAADNGLDATMHIWSLSINPTYTLARGDNGGLGAYVVGGVGFYHKNTNFTVPQQTYYCDYFYGCGYVYVNGTFDHYNSNAPGFDGGFGVTYKFSRFSNQRLFMEVKYVYIDNAARQGYAYSNGTVYTTAANADPNNYFPANSHHTSYIPVKFGIRF